MVYRESLKLQSRDRAVSFHDVTAQVKEIERHVRIMDNVLRDLVVKKEA